MVHVIVTVRTSPLEIPVDKSSGPCRQVYETPAVPKSTSNDNGETRKGARLSLLAGRRVVRNRGPGASLDRL